MRRINYYPFNPIELPDDVGELLELHSQAMSLNKRAENQLNLRKTEMKLIKEKLKEVRDKNGGVQVSDHAIVRYLERVYEIDIEACRREMVANLPKDYNHNDQIEFVEISTKDMKYVIRDNLIITVSPLAPKAKSKDKEDV